MGGNRELITYRLTRARETLEEARLMAASEHWHGCVNRLYYACFYAINALLLQNGLSSPKHRGVRTLFNKHFVAPGLVSKELAALYNTLFDSRHEADYEDFFTVDPNEAGNWLDQADHFIRHISTLINPSKSGH